MVSKRCVTCGRETTDYVQFKCPNCGTVIVRCQRCRASGKEWICPTCGFEGP